MVDAEERSSGSLWRGIEELAGLVGAYCWLEGRIFELTGTWASRVPAGSNEGGSNDAALRVWCAATSRRHGALARCWADRLPVRAGVDRATLVHAPSVALRESLHALGTTPALREGVGALVTVVLPRLCGAYEAHLATASAACEAPVMEVLAAAHRQLSGEIHGGGPLLVGPPQGPIRHAGDVASAGVDFEWAFDAAGIFPAVCPS